MIESLFSQDEVDLAIYLAKTHYGKPSFDKAEIQLPSGDVEGFVRKAFAVGWLSRGTRSSGIIATGGYSVRPKMLNDFLLLQVSAGELSDSRKDRGLPTAITVNPANLAIDMTSLGPCIVDKSRGDDDSAYLTVPLGHNDPIDPCDEVGDGCDAQQYPDIEIGLSGEALARFLEKRKRAEEIWATEREAKEIDRFSTSKKCGPKKKTAVFVKLFHRFKRGIKGNEWKTKAECARVLSRFQNRPVDRSLLYRAEKKATAWCAQMFREYRSGLEQGRWNDTASCVDTLKSFDSVNLSVELIDFCEELNKENSAARAQ